MVNLQGIQYKTFKTDADDLAPVMKDYVLPICMEVFRANHLRYLMVTSTTGGGHIKNSLHYKGRAIDLRLPSRVMCAMFQETWRKELYDIDNRVHGGLVESLGTEFQVFLETHQSSPYDWHIHVELDPK